MTPQQLVDMRGAGNAEKWLRKHGKWRKTAVEWLWAIPEGECSDSANSMIDKAIGLLENKMEDYT